MTSFEITPKLDITTTSYAEVAEELGVTEVAVQEFKRKVVKYLQDQCSGQPFIDSLLAEIPDIEGVDEAFLEKGESDLLYCRDVTAAFVGAILIEQCYQDE